MSTSPEFEQMSINLDAVDSSEAKAPVRRRTFSPDVTEQFLGLLAARQYHADAMREIDEQLAQLDRRTPPDEKRPA